MTKSRAERSAKTQDADHFGPAISPSFKRFYSLDFLRAFALLMGVLLHALSLYLEPADGSEPRLAAGVAFVWIHTWRMPLFMLLAGFFTALSLKKRSSKNYVLNRLIRLGVPLLLLWSLIPAIDEETAALFKMPELIAWIRHDTPFTLRLDHLWFLYYLLVFYAVLLGLKAALPGVYNAVTNFTLTFKTALFFWLPILILLSPWNKPVGGIFGDIPTTLGEIKLGSMLFMASFFLMGMQLHHSPHFMRSLARKKFWIPALIILSPVPVMLLGWGAMKDEPFTFSSTAEMWLINGLSAVSALLLVFSLIGATLSSITSDIRGLRWMVKLSYPIYVFHIMFVFSFGGTLMFMGLDAWLVVTLGFGAGILGPILLYYAFVWWTPLEWIFNGYKNARCQTKASFLTKITPYL